MDRLIQIRDQIDQVDQEMVRLLEQRMELSREVAEYKISVNKPVFDKTREIEKIGKVKGLASNEFNSLGVESIFNHIMAISRMRQYQLIGIKDYTEGVEFIDKQLFTKDTKVAFHGVYGAYGHQAMLGYFGEQVEHCFVPTFKEVMELVKNEDVEYGILPIENTSAGIVGEMYDLVASYDNYIVGEYIVKVDHALLGVKGSKISDIQTVCSHPQGLMQCLGYLEDKKWHQISVENTAIAAQNVVRGNDPTVAAIASVQAAKYHGLEILAEKINDTDNNSTKFIVVKRKKVYLKTANKLSICFEVPHSSGSLYHILAHFIFNGLSMSKIESRPIKGEKWKYRFFIDFEGNINEQNVKSALMGIESETINFKILGNYIGA